jgi:hypothetical protein
MWESWHGRWAAILYEPHPKHAIRISHFETEEEAAVAYDRVALQRWGPSAERNFPTRTLRPASVAAIRLEQKRKRKSRRASRWEGVSLRARGAGDRPWTAELRVDGERISVGSWATEDEAAVARDRAMLFYRPSAATRSLNLPERAGRLGPADAPALRAECERARKATTSSQFRGVAWAAASGAWRARITVRGELRHLGLYADEREAALAYDAAAAGAFGERAKLNFLSDRGSKPPRGTRPGQR